MKKGFTLIELIAVMIIVGVLALIAVPIVKNTIDKATKKANMTSAYNLVKSADNYRTEQLLDKTKLNKIEVFYFPDDVDKFDAKGKAPDDGVLALKDDGTIYAGLIYSNRCFIKLYTEDSFTESADLDDCNNSIQTNVLDNIMGNGMILDVARRYYTVDEIKSFIDIIATQHNSFLQMHFTDNENFGIESVYLNQTAETATVVDGVYTNPNTNLNFLTFEQVTEIMNYCKLKKVEFIPEIDIPSHMGGAFTLARLTLGDEAVNDFNWGTGSEAGMIDIARESGMNFIYSIYDEYTTFFSDCKYFHLGGDEYTFRIDEKIDFYNEICAYLVEKNFIPRMYNDSITLTNIDRLNRDVEISYWQYNGLDYATPDDFQDRGYNVLLTNFYYLFFVPSIANTTEENLEYTVNDIYNNWSINMWDLNNITTINRHDKIKNTFIAIWGENSVGVETDVIIEQANDMYNAMIYKNNQIED